MAYKPHVIQLPSSSLAFFFSLTPFQPTLVSFLFVGRETCSCLEAFAFVFPSASTALPLDICVPRVIFPVKSILGLLFIPPVLPVSP